MEVLILLPKIGWIGETNKIEQNCVLWNPLNVWVSTLDLVGIIIEINSETVNDKKNCKFFFLISLH